MSLNAAVIRIGQRVGVNADTLPGWWIDGPFRTADEIELELALLGALV